jgi:uncharacterized protein YggL (DUF469 family)
VKKRLRKKRRMGEFREWGCVMHFRLKSDSDLNEFLDIFVERVEEIGCYCGGGGSAPWSSRSAPPRLSTCAHRRPGSWMRI